MAGGDASTQDGTSKLHPTETNSNVGILKTSSSIANDLLRISDPNDLLRLKGSDSNSTQQMASQGNKLDERISCMRSEISQLKQWILMLQKNAESRLEQGDIGKTLPDLYRKFDQKNYKEPPSKWYK